MTAAVRVVVRRLIDAVELNSCRLVAGQSTSVFKRQLRPDLAAVSMSLLYPDPKHPGRTRSLDLVCKDRREVRLSRPLAVTTPQFLTWFEGFRYLTQGPPPQDELEARRALFLLDTSQLGSLPTEPVTQSSPSQAPAPRSKFMARAGSVLGAALFSTPEEPPADAARGADITR